MSVPERIEDDRVAAIADGESGCLCRLDAGVPAIFVEDLATELRECRAAIRALVELVDSLWEYGPKTWPPQQVADANALLPEHAKESPHA